MHDHGRYPVTGTIENTDSRVWALIMIVILIVEGGSGNTYCTIHTIMYSHADMWWIRSSPLPMYFHEFGSLPKNGLRSISKHSNFQNIHAPSLLVLCAYTHMLPLTDRSAFALSFHLDHQGVILHKFFGPYTQTGSYTSHCTWKVLEKGSTIPLVTIFIIFKSIATLTFLQCILLM